MTRAAVARSFATRAEVSRPFSTNLLTSLSGYWALNDASGSTATDATGATNGTVQGTPQWAAGRVQGGLFINGSSNYITLGNPSALKPTGVFTVDGWIKTTDAASGGVHPIFASYSQNTTLAGILFGDYQGKAYILSAKNVAGGLGTAYQQVQAVTINDANWHHLLTQWDGATLWLYVDGVLAGSVAWANAPAYGASNLAAIGAYSANGSTYSNVLTAQVDEVALWSRLLTRAEIAMRAAGTVYPFTQIARAWA